MKVLLIFSKSDKARFIGHLDLARVFRRAINMAKLPVAYSEGFNPHQKLSFAAPLALGMEGRNEAADLELAEACGLGPEDVMGRLNVALPKGILICKARHMGVGEKPPAALVSAARYEMWGFAGGALEEKAAGLLAGGSVIIAKKAKNGEKEVDVRQDIFSLEASNGRLNALLSAGGQRGLKPGLLAGAMGVSFGGCARLGLYKNAGDGFVPLFDN